jgi:tetratricopeptide (TPR) repeat protein
VFPRPAKGRRGIVRLGPRLYAVEDKAFQDGATFEADFASTPRMLRPLARILIESSLDEVRPDGTLTLREAILYLNGELELAAGERTQVEGDRGDPVAMTILAEEIKLASPLPVVRHPDLRIEGRGTRIGGAGAGRPVLSFEKSRQVAVTRLDLSGGIRVDGVGRFEARELVVRDFGAVGIEASGSTVYVARSRFSDGETALRVAQGTTDVVLSTFEGMATGIVLDGNSPSAVIGARFEGVGHPVDPGRLTANRSPGLLLVGNSAAGELRIAAAADPTRGDAAQARPRAAIFAANKPERLGLPEAGFAPNANAYWRYGFDDLRTGGRAAALHHLDFNDPDTACLVERQDAEPVVRYWPHVAILFDTPVTVSCVGRDASDSRVLVPPALAVDEAEDEGGAAVRGTALDQAAGVSVFVQPAASGGEVLSGAPLALRTVDVSDGATIPDRSAMQTYAGVAGIVARLLAAKQYQVAVDTALDAHRRVPGNSDVALLAVRSTDDWARALEAEERYDAAAGLYDRLRGSLRDPAVADRAYVAYLEQHAYNLVQRKSWEPARDAYLEAVALGGVRPQSEANLVYVYQEWARERAKSEPMEKVAAWLDAEADRSPSVRDKTRGMANTLINNAAVESIKSGQFREGLQLASLAYARNPVEATRNNLVYAFQENVRQSLAQADAAAAGATFATVRGRHPDVAFDGALEAAVYAEVKKKVDAGDGASGAAMAARMMAAADTKGLRDIYGYATSQRAAQVERAQGFGPAMKVWEDAARQFPRVAELGAGAASLANREAVRLLQAKQYRESIGVFRRGLTLSPGQATLEGNMKIAYTNWAIEEANARRYADAERVADEGLAIFRGDAKLIEVRDHARRARQGGR